MLYQLKKIFEKKGAPLDCSKGDRPEALICTGLYWRLPRGFGMPIARIGTNRANQLRSKESGFDCYAKDNQADVD